MTTERILLLSGGRVIQLDDLTPEQLERLALEQRAETGIIPIGLWRALTPAARERLQAMTQTMALRMLTPEPSRTTTPTMDAAELAELTKRSAAL